MATRKISSSIYREGWPGKTRDALAYCVCELADAWGLLQENPALLAAALDHPEDRYTLQDAQRAFDTFVARGTMVRYQVNGAPYLAFVRWQDRQGLKYFPQTGPNCPLPSLQVFRKLSPRTQANFAKLGEKLPANLRPEVVVAVAVAVGGKREEREAEDSVSACSFCRKPTNNPLQAIHDIYRKARGECPLGLQAKPKAHAANLARWRKILGDELLHACLREYCRSDDPFVVNAGYPLSLFWSEHTMQGLKTKVRAGEKKRAADKARRQRTAAQQAELEGKG